MNRSALDNASLNTLAQQAPNHLLWVILSPLSVATNLLVVITIASTKALHNKSQFLILSYSAAEVIYALCYFFTGLIRFLAYVLSKPETSNQLFCMLKQSPLVFMGAVVKNLGVILSVDRLLCLAFPIFYKNRDSFKYTVFCNAIVWGYSVVKLGFGFQEYDQNKWFGVCAFTTSFAPGFVAYSSTESSVTTGLVAAIYFLATAILFRRYRSATFTGVAQKSEWKRQMDFDVFIAVAGICVIFLITTGLGSILNAIASYIGGIEIAVKLAPVSSALILISSISHFFVYFKLNRLFRKSFRTVVMKREDNSVVPLV